MRNARALARLFEFEEFEDYFENIFGHAPTLRVAADLIAQRAVRRARVEKGYSSEGRGKRAESREQEEHTGDKREVEGSKMSSGMPQNEPKRAQDSLKRGRKRPKTAPRGAQEG